MKHNFESKQNVIKYFIQKHLKVKGNMLHAEKLFVVNSILEWAFENSKNPQILKIYIEDLEKYIEGKIELNWSHDS